MLKQVIKENFSSFTKAEKKIADYILQDKENHIIAMTLAELSATLNLGEATIVRFCRKINCKGFQDMKFAIALEDTSVAVSYTHLDVYKRQILRSVKRCIFICLTADDDLSHELFDNLMHGISLLSPANRPMHPPSLHDCLIWQTLMSYESASFL